MIPEHPPAPLADPRQERRLPRSTWLLSATLGVLALVTRLPRLTQPRVLVFDEVFYATQGWEISRHGVEQGGTVHPPLAKWLLAAGIKTFGFTPFGWRIIPLLAGVVMVMATVIAAYRLWPNLWAAGLAGLVVATDGIAFTSGRLALLDGILGAFTTVTLALVAAVVARPLDVPLRRRSVWIVGLVLGAAVACKWSALPLVLVVIVVFAVLSWRTTPAGTFRRRDLGRTALCLLGLPLAVYCVSYLPTLIRFEDSAIGRDLCGRTQHCNPGPVERATEIVRNQTRVWHFHESLVPRNRYANNAASWVFQTEPVGLLSSTCPSADPVCSPRDRASVRRVISIGNPAVWALGTLALAATLLLGLARHDPRRGLVAAWAAALWLPWVVRPRLSWFPLATARPGYTFYATPLVPALAMALGATWLLLHGRRRIAAGASLLAIMVVGAVLLYPIWTGMAVSPGYLVGLVAPHG